MIAIPNMDKPKECIECEFSCLWANGSTHCMVDGEELFCDGIPQRHDCPLIDIVTCGECICYRGDHNYCANDYFARENGFCSYGERRNDGEL